VTLKRKSFLILMILLVLFTTTAIATDLEINYPNVNFRSEPGGNVIGTFSGGEVLAALDETWTKGQLWYHAHSDLFGDGYMSMTMKYKIHPNEKCLITIMK